MVFLVSCASTPHLETSAVLPFPPADQQIRLGPGDTLNIRFRYWPELDETQTVRPDGKITLQIVDDVAVTGMTPAELDQKLTELYSQSLKDPEITVIVRSYVSQRVYVGGEVRTPGLQPIQGDLDLLSAIIAAGGFINMSADKENVIVFRHVDTKRYAASINLQELMELPEADRILLAPNDIVYVGRLGIDEANQWVDQYIQRLIPGYNAALNALIYASLRN
ncbi:MAG: polysaccharide biosynthesis/export family protein [bacterium]